MLEELTKEQTAKLKDYKELYIKKGLLTERINKKKCQKVMDEFYEKILDREPVKVLICKNPIEAFRMCFLYMYLKEKIKKKKNEIIDMIEKWREKKEDNSKEKIMEKTWDDVLQIKTFIYPYLYGSFDTYYFSFYSFFLNECGLLQNHKEKYLLYEKLIDFGYIYAMNDICCVSEKPLEINKNEKGLHADGKPALKYDGDFNLYRLNGVKVPEWLVMTKKEDLKAEKLYEIENVEVRQEFIEKIGVKRVLEELKCQEIEVIKGGELYQKYPITNYIQQGDVILEPEYEKDVKYKDLTRSFKKSLGKIIYKLMNLQIKNGDFRPYLYMSNASKHDDIHIEGVNSDCKNVFDAICYRNKKKSLPFKLT